MSPDKPDPLTLHPKDWKRLKPLAREMRHDPTLAEDRLWEEIRNRKLCDAKFRPQQPIECYIVDFFCKEASLIVEVDGDIHETQREDDAIRQTRLEALGLRVLRFSNEQVLAEIKGVLEVITEALPHPPHPG